MSSTYERVMELQEDECLWRTSLRSGRATQVTKVPLVGGGFGIRYFVNETHRQSWDIVRLDERVAAENSWLNGWTLYDTEDEAIAAAQARLSQMSSIERDVLVWGSH